jgi:hypothetical protein
MAQDGPVRALISYSTDKDIMNTCPGGFYYEVLKILQKYGWGSFTQGDCRGPIKHFGLGFWVVQ